jgi:pimeloyl-ACP methyl ester carboxylesterase
MLINNNYSVHGLGSSQNYYLPVVSELIKHGFRCIIFDNTGAGRSPYTHVEQSIDGLSNDTIQVLDALEAPKAILVGHSMGGIVAANLSATQSNRIVASVWIGPVYPGEHITGLFNKRIETVERDGMEGMANTIPNAALGSKASGLVKAMIRELLLGQDPAGYVSNCRVIAGAKPPDYDKIKIPVLVIAGEEDKSAALDLVKKMYGEIGTEEKKLVVLEGIGHWQCLEAPELVAKHILDFYHEIQ